MSQVRIIGIFATLLLSTNSSYVNANSMYAGTVDQSFRNCAAKAMQQRDQNAASIIVNNRDLTAAELDHDHSTRQRQYRMKLSDSKSGEFIGDVTCKLSKVGEIISAAFDR